MLKRCAIFAGLAVCALCLAPFTATLAGTGGVNQNNGEVDQIEPNAPGWPRTFGPGDHSAPGPGGRTFTVVTGSIRIQCRTNGTFVWDVRSGTEWIAGQTGDDWGDTTFVAGSRSEGTVKGENSSLRFPGNDANIDTNGNGGGSVTTLPGSTGKTGDIDGTGVDFHLHGSGNVFQYNGGTIRD